ncbi:Interleukin-9 receptor, partial [Ophiophagus hannah]
MGGRAPHYRWGCLLYVQPQPHSQAGREAALGLPPPFRVFANVAKVCCPHLDLRLKVGSDPSYREHPDFGDIERRGRFPGQILDCLPLQGEQDGVALKAWGGATRQHGQGTGSSRDGLPSSSTLRLSGDLICPLSASPGTPGHFDCSAYSEEGEFTENDEYKVVLHTSSLGENHTDVVFVKYKPRLHIQCDPPFDLQSKCSDTTCRLCWKRPKAYEEILEVWQWELAFKAVQEPWEVGEAKGRRGGFEFKSDRDYVARMRCKTPEENHHYGSHWSPWSSCVTWTAQPGWPPGCDTVLMLN